MPNAEAQNHLEEAAGSSRPGLCGELWGMLKANKKWWLLPIVLVIMLIGVLVLLSSTAAAPFIYTLF
jgi:hypothetical protein